MYSNFVLAGINGQCWNKSGQCQLIRFLCRFNFLSEHAELNTTVPILPHFHIRSHNIWSDGFRPYFHLAAIGTMLPHSVNR